MIDPLGDPRGRTRRVWPASPRPSAASVPSRTTPDSAFRPTRGAIRSVPRRLCRQRPRARDTGESHACAVELRTEDQVSRLFPLVISRWITLWITLWIELGI
jgi:hypothetical protein